MAAGEIMAMDAVDLAAAIRARRVSCAEVMDACLDQVEAFNPAVTAIVALREREALLAEARDKDAQLARGEAVGPLHGLPHAVKDLQPVKGLAFTQGSPLFKDVVAPADLLPDSNDTRLLGVAVRAMALDGVTLALDDSRLGAGWHEREKDLRWTDGEGVLEIGGAGVVEIWLAATVLRYHDRAEGVDRKRVLF